jgi:hypothetical protein
VKKGTAFTDFNLALSSALRRITLLNGDQRVILSARDGDNDRAMTDEDALLTKKTPSHGKGVPVSTGSDRRDTKGAF